MRTLIALLVLTLGLSLVSYRATGQAAVKPSVYALGAEALDNMRMVGRGYGTRICEEAGIKDKAEIKLKAWSKIQQSCSKFTLGLTDKFSDDPNTLFSLCIGSSLYGCQTAIGMSEPCEDLKSCQALLGVP